MKKCYFNLHTTYTELRFNFIHFIRGQSKIYLAICIFLLKSFQPETVYFFDNLCDIVSGFVVVCLTYQGNWRKPLMVFLPIHCTKTLAHLEK